MSRKHELNLLHSEGTRSNLQFDPLVNKGMSIGEMKILASDFRSKSRNNQALPVQDRIKINQGPQ